MLTGKHYIDQTWRDRVNFAAALLADLPEFTPGDTFDSALAIANGGDREAWGTVDDTSRRDSVVDDIYRMRKIAQTYVAAGGVLEEEK